MGYLLPYFSYIGMSIVVQVSVLALLAILIFQF